MQDNSGFDASRRGFLRSVPLLAATLVHCSHTLLDQTRFADAFIIDPDGAAYRPVLDALIATILPLGREDFPLRSPDAIRSKLLAMFPLDSDERLAGVQRMITLFDQIDLFTIFSGPLLQQEAIARDLEGDGGTLTRIAATIRESDAKSLAAFRHEHSVAAAAQFTHLAQPARNRYFALWHESESIVKRQFHGALRSLVMVTAYSMDELWNAIHYGGPLLPRKDAVS